MPVNGIKIFAHRGAAITSMENTLEAFERAKQEGADGTECDIRLTSDGEVVVFHDDAAERVTGAKRLIREMTWKEVSELRVYGKSRIPHMKDILEFMAGWPEGEAYFDLHEKDLRLPETAVKVLASAPELMERSYILDFYIKRELLARAKSLDPRVRLSVMPGAPWNIAPSVALGARSLCMGWDKPWTHFLYTKACLFYDPRPALAAAKAAGISISGGVANTAKDIRYLLKQGVTGIWTDDLVLARSELSGMDAGMLNKGAV